MTRYTLDIDVLTKQGFICTPAYAGLFVLPIESHETFYFSHETGEVRQVSSEETEALTI